MNAKATRIPKVLPGIRLSPQQWQALQEMEAFLKSGDKLYLLTGYAGTGKTTLLQALIKRLRQKRDHRSVVFTAFSNKATKVLAAMTERWDLEITCMTCCKLLGLRPEIDPNTGQQVFKPDRQSENYFNRYRLVVVDEASMINQEMWRLLVNAVSSLNHNTQLLCVGDIAQLPPINEPESPVFQQIYQRSDLTEIVRYRGAIAGLAESIRNHLHNPNLPEFVTQTTDDRTEGILVLRCWDWEKLMIRAFKSESSQQDSDYVRVLAYTNQRVNQLNRTIRTAIYGDRVPRFVVGERLFANAPCLVNDSVLLQNSAECEVLEVNTGQEGSWQVWCLHVLTDEGKSRTLTVLHEQSQTEFTEKLAVYAQDKRWREFWDLKNLFHDLSYAYCLTTHKAQGSTFQNVFVDVPNVMVNQNVRERNQLLYVAVTRAAQRLFICQY